MSDWIVLHLGDIFVASIIILVVILILRSIIQKRKKGMCGSCTYCSTSDDKDKCLYQDLSREDLKKLLDEEVYPKNKK